MNFYNTAALYSAFIILTLTASAQKKSDAATQNPWVAVSVDARHQEWGDSLKNFDTDTKFHYEIANDNENVYIAIELSDKMRLRNIIAGGITVFINTEGKKKDGQSVIFPVTAPRRPAKNADPEKEIRQSLIAAKAIKVAGFNAIPDGNISVNNDYGIKAAAALNDSSKFIYEAAIPISRLNLGENVTRELFINIRLNIPDHPPRVSRITESPYETQRRRNRGDYSAPQSRTVVTTTQPAGVWIKRILAIKPPSN